MTTREYFQTVLDAHISDDMDKASAELIAKLDARNEKRKSADSKPKKEAAARRNAVLDFLCNHQGEQFTRDQIAEAVKFSAPQVTGACKPLVDDGTIKKDVVLIEKSRKVVYTYPVEE